MDSKQTSLNYDIITPLTIVIIWNYSQLQLGESQKSDIATVDK